MTIEQHNDEIVAEVLPDRRPRQQVALGQLHEQVQALQDARTWAEILCAPDNDLCPAQYRGKVGSGIAAILYGAELGLNPTQSLQQVFVVHGMPAIYARTAVALCKGAGIHVETVESSDESVTVQATDPAHGLTERATWTIERATKAGYTSNKKYQTDPQAMLYAKAAMEVCRKIAPDVLLGIPMSREELDLESQPIKVQSERSRGVSGLASTLGLAAPAPQQEEPTPTTDVRYATGAQLRSLAMLRRSEGYGDDEEGREGWFTWLNTALATEGITSNKSLTEAQAGEIISMLEQDQNRNDKGGK